MATLVELKELRKITSDKQIIEKFKSACIPISKIETKGRENGMICVIYRDSPNFYHGYFSAYVHFKEVGLIS